MMSEPNFEVERVVEAMTEFDHGLPDEVRERIASNDSDFQNYKAVVGKLDELYYSILKERDEDPKEVKIEAIRALEYFSYKYDVDVTHIQKMLV